MPGTQNGPCMDEDSVGPRQRLAGSPVGYKHGMRDGIKRQWETKRGGCCSDGMRRTGSRGRNAIRRRKTKRRPGSFMLMKYAFMHLCP